MKFLILTLLLISCGDEEFSLSITEDVVKNEQAKKVVKEGTEKNTEEDDESVTDENEETVDICNPFEDEGSANIVGNLYNSSDLLGRVVTGINDQGDEITQEERSFLFNVIEKGKKITKIVDGVEKEVRLFLPNLNVTPRNFEEGFATSENEFITDKDGNVLYEWFGFELTGYLKLSENDPEGYYEFGAVSDDGVELMIEEDGEDKLYISRQFKTSPHLHCFGNSDKITNKDHDGRFIDSGNNIDLYTFKKYAKNQLIYMNKNTKIKYRLRYNQGPGSYLAMVLMMRHWENTSDYSRDSKCNSTYMYANSVADLEVQNRPWKVMQSDNFALPDNVKNKCKK